VRERIVRMEKSVEYLAVHQAEQMQSPSVPPVAKAIFDHTLAHTSAELAWTRELLAKLEGGEYN
jgi:hypothetical protein